MRLRYGQRALLRDLSLTLILISAAASGAGFPCDASLTATESAICAKPALSQLDDILNQSFKAVIADVPPAQRTRLYHQQKLWLSQRDACGTSERCIGERMQQRIAQLNEQGANAAAGIDTLIASIASQPKSAAQGLMDYDNGLASAWLLYLHQFEPTSGVTDAEAKHREEVAYAALREGDGFMASLFDDIKNDPETSRDKSVMLLLRMSIESANYQSAPGDGYRPFVHCFIFQRQGRLAYDTFGALYGSTRDAGAPICPPDKGLFESSGWLALNQAMGPLTGSIGEEAGTIRFSSYAEWRLLNLQATVSPELFLSSEISGRKFATSAQILQRLKALTARGAPVIKALDSAESDTANWLQRARAFSPAKAKIAATHIVNMWLQMRLDFIDSMGEDMDE